ncbi:MAG: rhomboid family intramembrane serine protease [Mucilaginibacter sp.]
MKDLDRKIKLIFIPFVIIAAATCAVYTFLHWILCIRTTTFVVDEDVTNFFIPCALPWIPILIWLRPRIKLLNLKNKNGKGDPLMGYMVFAWVAIAAPSVIAQEYLISATGKLTKLNDIDQINKLPSTKYYTVKHYYIDKKLVRVKPVFDVSGRYNSDFDMSIYAPCPIFERNNPIDTLGKKPVILPPNMKFIINGRSANYDSLKKINPALIKSVTVLKGAAAAALYGQSAFGGLLVIKTKIDGNDGLVPCAWLAIVYQKTINNRLSRAEKEKRYSEFAKQSEADFERKDLNGFVYLDKVGPGKKFENYINAINAKGNFGRLPIILSPVNEPFEERNGSKLPWIFGSFAIGALAFLICLLFKPFKNDLEINPSVKNEESKSSWIEIKAIFFPREGYYITPIIIGVNLLVFIIMCCYGLGFISFSAIDLLRLGANYRPSVSNGQYWRLITNIFLHGGVMHVLFNMYGLLFVGIFLEPLLGKVKYALVYISTGIIASITSIWWHPATISVGASGAIFGMYGVFFALLTTNLFPKDFKKSFLISTSIFIGYNLLNGLIGGIDNAAHLGGLFSGLLLGYAIYPGLNNKSKLLEGEDETQKIVDELTTKKTDN